MVLWFVVSLLLCWRFQFGISSLLVLAVAVALPCSWFSWEMKKAKRQKAAYDVIRKYGEVCYDLYVPLPPINTVPRWLRDMFGDDFFANVDYVCLDGGEELSDAEVAFVEESRASSSSACDAGQSPTPASYI